MAVIGALGGTVFSVSANTVKTFENMNWDSSTNYAQHERHIAGTLLEYIGPASDVLTFDMLLSAFLGVNPDTELANLRANQRYGSTMSLVIGSRRYGSRWVITNLKTSLLTHDNRGNLLVAKVRVSLKSYY